MKSERIQRLLTSFDAAGSDVASLARFLGEIDDLDSETLARVSTDELIEEWNRKHRTAFTQADVWKWEDELAAATAAMVAVTVGG